MEIYRFYHVKNWMPTYHNSHSMFALTWHLVFVNSLVVSWSKAWQRVPGTSCDDGHCEARLSSLEHPEAGVHPHERNCRATKHLDRNNCLLLIIIEQTRGLSSQLPSGPFVPWRYWDTRCTHRMIDYHFQNWWRHREIKVYWFFDHSSKSVRWKLPQLKYCLSSNHCEIFLYYKRSDDLGAAWHFNQTETRNG